jgi:hypothetical protein
MTVSAKRRLDHDRRSGKGFGCGFRDEMIGNKAGFNDSIEERRVTLAENGRGVVRAKRAARHSVQIWLSLQWSAWLRLYRKISDDVAQHPRAHGLRGNLTQAAESSLKPDRSLFERNREVHRPCRPARLVSRLTFSKN